MKRFLLWSLTLLILVSADAALAAVKWVWTRDGSIPPGAVKGGFVAGEDLYICRASYFDGMHVGKVFRGRCHFGWGGREVVRQEFEMLVDRGEERWVGSDRALPNGAVRAGHAPAGDIFICRAQYRDGMHPGKLVGGRCLIGWGGRELDVVPYEVLVMSGGKWQPTSSGHIPRRAVVGGYTTSGGLLICRSRLPDGVHPGKVFQGECHVGWDGQEMIMDPFEVLVRPHGAMRWIPGDEDGVGRRCVSGRRGGRNQCICRGHYRDGLHVGKVVNDHCNIGWDGKEVELDDFEVLVRR